MAFTRGDQDALEQARDAALAAHTEYWAGQGHEAKNDAFFPGFEAGWEAANQKLENGEELPEDLEGWAREHGSPDWEFEHGFRQGAEAARGAGQHHDEEQQEEEHHDEE